MQSESQNIYNAISHKDYTGPAIQMRIYDKSIELWNYGLLPKELTQAKLLKKHSSFPRNHNIANAFYKAGFVESWGRGFKKIAEEFEKAKLPLPTIEEECGGVMAVIQRKTVDEIIQERESGGNVGENIGRNVGDVSEFKLSERQTIIKNIISSSPTVTAKQMSETLSVTSRTIERDLSAMQKAGIIRHEGKDNAGTWVVLEQKKQKRYER
jgi:ATP-dependent DNA helicase RecG